MSRRSTGRCVTGKYHAGRYGLGGEVTFVQQEDECFGIDKADYGLKPVRCEVWDGFIFVNLDPHGQPLGDYLGELAAAAHEDSVERLLLAVPDTALARAWTRALASRVHMAGTPPQAVTRAYLLALQDMIGAPIAAVGVGPRRDQTLQLRDLI